MPFRTLKLSSITLVKGARQLVVQLALEMMWCLDGSYLSSLTPRTIVISSFLAGAEIRTFLAPPAKCVLAFSASVNTPEHSRTISTPCLAQLRAAKSFSLRI